MDFYLENVKTPFDKLKASWICTRFYFELCEMDEEYSKREKLEDSIISHVKKYNPEIGNMLFIKDESTNKIIGITRYTDLGDITFVDWLYIKPKYRGQGIATSVLDVIRGLTNHNLTLVTLSKNENAISFYKDYGFQQVGTNSIYGYDITELYYGTQR